MRRFRWNVLGVTVGGLVFAASTAAVLPSSATAPVAAQERDSSRRYDPKELVERLDQNKNGMVEPDEMQGRLRYFLERIAPQMGLDLTKPIPNDKLMEAVKNAPPREGSSGGPPGSGGPGGGPGGYGGPGSSGGPGGPSGGPGGSSSSGGSSGGGSSSSGRREEKAPLVPGFGAPSNLPKPPGFDGALAMATAAASSAESRYDRRVVEYVDRMMRDYDKNKDSQLDADEMKAVQWTGDPKESDTNRDGKLSRLELLDRIAKKWGSTTSPSSSSSGRSGSGFGSSSGSSSSSGGTSAADEAAKVRRYAEGLLKQYDANKNGVLDKDEWTQVRTITPDTDANKDGAVTIEELTAKLSGFGQQGAGSSGGGSSSSSSSSGGGDRDRDRDRGGFGGGGGPPGGFGGSRPGFGSSSGSPGSGSRDKNANDKNKSYRQKSPLERLPKGLPDWFARNDANADGQVSMAEFSTSWSESKAAEFAGYDLNGDGVVTPQECLKAAEKGKTGPSGSYGGSSGGGSYGSSSGSGSSGGSGGGFSRDRGGDRGSDRGGPGGGPSSSSGSGGGSSGSSSGSGGSRFSGFSRGGDRPGGDRGGDRSTSDSSKGSSSSSSSSKSDDAKPAETKSDDAKSSEETKPAAEAKPAEESKPAGDAKPSDAT